MFRYPISEKDRRLDRELSKKRRDEVYNHLSKITIFRGSLSEYEKWRGYDCEILGASYRLPFGDTLILSKEDIKMYEEGIEALVNAQGNKDYFPLRTNQPIGLPVRKKR